MLTSALAEFMTLDIYVRASVIVAILLYPPLIWQVLTRRAVQNLATFILWGMLDGIAAGSLFVKGGSWILPATYVVGCMMVITALVYVRTMKWTWLETAISAMVIACIVAWTQSGPRMATILSSTGVGLASLPQLWDTIKDPRQSPFLIYAGYTIANALNVIGGSEWSVEQRLYPSVCVILCMAIAIAASRRPKVPAVRYEGVVGIFD